MTIRVLMFGVLLVGCVHEREAATGAAPQQLLVVLTEDWATPAAVSTLYQRNGSGWREVASGPAVVGKNGLGWGRGLAVALPRGADEPIKREGDGKAPAGVFRIGDAFGATAIGGAWRFRVLKPTTECVDDVASAQYNRTVENDAVVVDWKSSEKMASEPLYRVGAFVEHNVTDTQVGAGSCIFMHVWREQGRGTAGCTAFDEAQVRKVLSALRPEANPILIQLPRTVYAAHRAEAGWP